MGIEVVQVDCLTTAVRCPSCGEVLGSLLGYFNSVLTVMFQAFNSSDVREFSTGNSVHKCYSYLGG